MRDHLHRMRGASRYWRRLRRSALALRIVAPFGRDLHPERWIFIVGCYNSGTTLLARLLAAHPAIGALPDEGVFYTDALPYPEKFGWGRMWHRCAEQVRLAPGQLDPALLRRIRRHWSLWYPKDRPALLEKSVVNSARIPFFDVHFQPAYFISIVRDGYAVAEGIHRKARPSRWNNPEYRDRYPIELCAMQWAVTAETLERDRKRVERYHQVHYEDLTREPTRVLGGITDFLGIDQLDEQLVHGSWQLQGRDSPIVNMNDESFARLSSNDVDMIEQTAGEWLRFYGYGRPTSIASFAGPAAGR